MLSVHRDDHAIPVMDGASIQASKHQSTAVVTPIVLSLATTVHTLGVTLEDMPLV